MDVPQGYEPVVACTFCPPGGIFFQLAVYLFDIGNDMLQMLTFVHHGDFWFAGFMAIFVALNFLATFLVARDMSLSQTKRCDLLGEAKLCVARQVPTRAWQVILFCERNIEAPGTGLIGPYGASRLALTPLQAASGLYGLYSSAKAMAEGRVDQEAEVGGLGGTPTSSYALKAVRPAKAAMLFLWYFCTFAAELAAFAVVSATLHPLVTLPGYVLGALANGVAQWWSGDGGLDGGKMATVRAIGLSCISVALAMAGGQSRAFTKSGPFGGPGWIPAAFILIRFFAWAGLCFFVDLPHGLLPLGSLGRPMGFPVLQAKFLRPAAACREALVCFTSQTWETTETQANSTLWVFTAEVGFGACAWPATDELTTPATIFNTCLLVLAVVLVPIHICVVVAMLVLNPTYSSGAENPSARDEILAKQREIDEFARHNEQSAGQHTELRLLAEGPGTEAQAQ
ncbi:unnamed protein product [Symbiodinium sp. CCMP2592]|nr:unnamed protein product [Symbiodinium sp. CCMP2592]